MNDEDQHNVEDVIAYLYCTCAAPQDGSVPAGIVCLICRGHLRDDKRPVRYGTLCTRLPQQDASVCQERWEKIIILGKPTAFGAIRDVALSPSSRSKNSQCQQRVDSSQNAHCRIEALEVFLGVDLHPLFLAFGAHLDANQHFEWNFGGVHDPAQLSLRFW